MSHDTMRFIDPAAPLPEGTVQWPNTEDVQAHAAALPGIAAIALDFPKWTDGRAYSQAVLLRLRLGWRGELIATGQVLADMLPLMRRCGFSAVQLRADQKLETAQRALGFFDGHYQRGADVGHGHAQSHAQAQGQAARGAGA